MCKAARAPVIYHNRPSPRLEFCGWTPFPTLSISDAERRAYHNRRVSDAPIHSVSSTRCGFSFAPHPYPVAASRDPTLFISNVLHKRHHSAVGSRLGATGQACGKNHLLQGNILPDAKMLIIRYLYNSIDKSWHKCQFSSLNISNQALKFAEKFGLDDESETKT